MLRDLSDNPSCFENVLRAAKWKVESRSSVPVKAKALKRQQSPCSEVVRWATFIKFGSTGTKNCNEGRHQLNNHRVDVESRTSRALQEMFGRFECRMIPCAEKGGRPTRQAQKLCQPHLHCLRSASSSFPWFCFFSSSSRGFHFASGFCWRITLYTLRTLPTAATFIAATSPAFVEFSIRNVPLASMYCRVISCRYLYFASLNSPSRAGHNGTWMSCALLSRLSAHSPSLSTLSSRGLLSSLCVISAHRARSSAVEVPWAAAFGVDVTENTTSTNAKVEEMCFRINSNTRSSAVCARNYAKCCSG